MEPMDNSILDQAPAQSYSTVPSNPKRGGKKIWIIIVIVAVAISAFLFFRPSENSTAGPTPTASQVEIIQEPTTAPDAETTTTPEPTEADVVKTGPSIQVQNGSGTEGVAGEMQTDLKDSGYNNVETGNADNFDYTGVTIKSKDSTLATAKKIKTQLTGYTFEEEIATLSEDSDFDIVIIVGK